MPLHFLKNINQFTSKEYLCKGVSIEEFKKSLRFHMDDSEESFISDFKESKFDYKIVFSESKPNEFWISKTNYIFDFNSRDPLEADIEDIHGVLGENRSGISIKLTSKLPTVLFYISILITILLLPLFLFINDVISLVITTFTVFLIYTFIKNSAIKSFIKFDETFLELIKQTESSQSLTAQNLNV